MALDEIKGALGIARVIWIDDVFGEPSIDLAILARKYSEIQSEFPELSSAFEVQGFGDVDAKLQQSINDLEESRRAELQASLLQRDAAQGPARELAPTAIETVCEILGIAIEDRWTFEKADGELEIIDLDDANTGYIIDLKEGGGPERRGLGILSRLRAKNSQGVAFILTHEAALDGEAALERSLEADVVAPDRLALRITVISKERLTSEGADIEASLAIGLKRAGLRRALHKVLKVASQRAAEAYAATAASLLDLEPERLEQYVYKRGAAEGVSELHVVERALTAGASKELRAFFGSDAAVHEAILSLRTLQTVKLDSLSQDPGPTLTGLRDAEIWDDANVINAAFTPLANGDVFCFDESEPGGPYPNLRFVLLGQPCDVVLRADGKRGSDTAMLVPMREFKDDGTPLVDPNDLEGNETDKASDIPFRINGKLFKLEIRNMAYAKLAILDLACFRQDGCVRVETGHTPPVSLLIGGQTIYGLRTAAADSSLGGPMPPAVQAGMYSPVDDRLLMTMSDSKPWDRVRLGKRLAALNGKGHHLGSLPGRVTWLLKRDGRIRAPYSAFLLERTLRTLGRQAFDMDYTV